MTRREIERYFTALSRRWTEPLQVILIGGAAAVLAGSRRMTRDVDFEARLARRPAPEDGDVLAAAIRRATIDSGVRAQFAVNIGSWSDVAMPDYRTSARTWRTFGAIRVQLLSPAMYVVSKLRRGASKDFEDVVLVGRATRLSWRRAAMALGHAVHASPPSTQLPPFKERVEHLFRRYGRDLWGTRFDPNRALAIYRRRATSR